MDVYQERDNFGTLGATVEEAKKRCEAVMDAVEALHLSLSCKRTLLRLIQSELSFLSRFSSTDFTPNSEPSICVNIGHLEAVVHILKHPNISGVPRVCKTILVPPSTQSGIHSTTSKGAHVDIVCTFDGSPVWFIVSDRNPKYVSWYGQQESSKKKGLRARVQLLLEVAHYSVTLKPTSLIFFFSNGLDGFTRQKFHSEFGAIDLGSKFSNFDFNFSEELGGEWIDILARSYHHASVLEIKVDSPRDVNPHVPKESLVAYSSVKASDVNLGGSFNTLLSQMISPYNGKLDGILINFDTTALIAIVSGISNGNTEKLLATPEDELKTRFKGNYEFVIGQVMSEIRNPIHMDIAKSISGRKAIICESVSSEFKELVSMCGGSNEKLRAGELLKHVVVVPDSPSTRMTSLPTTRKLAMKNKIVFGTGDHWHAPTLTANMGFVRAVLQTGMSLFTFEHRPRALTGD
ncbi:UPF0415 protein C7orf25 homolog isoform X1 [Cynara cardunculus var. scolymus]|uniref:DUF1308 domain-containing protein n=1 Tax=Cynara cardunculus var. scolymus TaxID=59895 RepID=A0A118K769_CYNCS|nr:UPF0415 protein C7orf25 homolog isoform X1 [Cynara cardunculus var. scolymus]KVI11733.1 Protein of unknown function DUF1308 [Cynara cardunculus var. scolymus]